MSRLPHGPDVRPPHRSGTSDLTALHVVQPVEGGVARVVVDLVRAQTANGMRVAVACPSGTPLAAAVREAGAEPYAWEAVRDPGPGLPRECRRIGELVRLVRPDVVHAHSAKAGLAARVAVRGRIPTVYQPHAWSFEAVGGTTAALARHWERWAARWTSRIVCVSDDERRTGERAGVRAAWSVVHNGVDVARFETETDPPIAAFDGPTVVCVGRLCRQKGQDVLLRAWPQVLAELPEARLVLVGDGPDGERLRAAAPPSVVLAGAVDDTAPWYRAADLVVLPSRWEGMALAPLEAMASGRPVLVSEVDGARESLPPGHAPHCLVPPEDPAALAAAMVRLLAQPELLHTLGREARQHVVSRFDVRRTGAAIAEVYRAVAGSPCPELREPISQ
ncbi:glycosyltransferase [Streptomyces purpureus]|uniref:Glycosyl transferase family 1 n=1 Tax=Streptomyces purpureus TaxID=1951 RepID=A0A918HBU8_9ACTN|nr:glycosyltransferase [Streptomyces purpureus]GGT52849.1 glycosyl transferase family 1 [Streptomyces purpureus]